MSPHLEYNCIRMENTYVWALLTNITRLSTSDKHSSLFVRIVGEEEKKVFRVRFSRPGRRHHKKQRQARRKKEEGVTMVASHVTTNGVSLTRDQCY
jgi:hypothetical protein